MTSPLGERLRVALSVRRTIRRARSLAGVGGRGVGQPRSHAGTNPSPSASRRTAGGSWPTAPPSAASAAEVIQQTRSDAARLRGGREVLLAPRPGDPDDRGARPAAGRRRPRPPATLAGPRRGRRVPGPARPAGRGRHDSGPARARQSGVCRLRRARLGRRHGQAADEDRVPRAGPAGAGLARRRAAGLAGRSGRRRGAHRADADVSAVREAREHGIERGHLEGGRARRRWRPRSTWRRSSIAGSSSRTASPDAREIECAVLGNAAPEASVPGEIVPSREFYDYEAKYIDAARGCEIPARLDAADGRRDPPAGRAGVSQAIDGAGLARVDFLLSRTTGALFINEINTMPGFTTISMFSKMWAASGVDYRGARRSTDRARARTSRGEAAAQDERLQLNADRAARQALSA